MNKSTEEITEENIKKEIESGYFDWRGKNEGIQIYNNDKKENNINENKSFAEIKSDLAMIDYYYITKKLTSTSYYGKKVLPYLQDLEGFKARKIDEMRAFYAHIQYKEKYDEENSKKSKKKVKKVDSDKKIMKDDIEIDTDLMNPKEKLHYFENRLEKEEKKIIDEIENKYRRKIENIKKEMKKKQIKREEEEEDIVNYPGAPGDTSYIRQEWIEEDEYDEEEIEGLNVSMEEEISEIGYKRYQEWMDGWTEKVRQFRKKPDKDKKLSDILVEEYTVPQLFTDIWDDHDQMNKEEWYNTWTDALKTEEETELKKMEKEYEEEERKRKEKEMMNKKKEEKETITDTKKSNREKLKERMIRKMKLSKSMKSERKEENQEKEIKEVPITKKISDKYILYEDIIDEKGMKVDKSKYIKGSDSLNIVEKFPKRFVIKESRSIKGHKYLYDKINKKSAWIESIKKGGKRIKNKKTKKSIKSNLKKSKKKP